MSIASSSSVHVQTSYSPLRVGGSDVVGADEIVGLCVGAALVGAGEIVGLCVGPALGAMVGAGDTVGSTEYVG